MAEVNIVSPIPQAPGTAGVVPHPQDVGESITISGTIIGKDSGGNFLLRTLNGNLALQSHYPLTYNSDVVLRLSNTGAATNARIVSVNGEAFSQFAQAGQPETDSVSNPLLQTSAPVQAAQAQSANPDSIPALVVASTPDTPPENPAQTPTQAGNPQQPATLPQPGTAVVIHLPPTPPQGALPLPGTQLPPGANTEQQTAAGPQQLPQTQQPQATLQIATAVTQNLTEVPSPQLATQAANVNTNAPQNTVSRATQPVTPQPTQVQLQGAIIQQAVEQVVQTAPNPLYAAYAKQASQTQTQTATPQQLAAQATSAAEEDQPAARFTPVQGQVTEVAKDGTLTVQTPIGQVVLKPEAVPAAAAGKLSVGTPVTIDLPEENQTGGILQNIISAMPASFAEVASSWDTAKAIITLLTNNATETTDDTQPQPPPAGGTLARIPVMGPSFTASSLSFLSALASGDAHKVLGDDAINTLKSNGQSMLVQRFTSEVANLSAAMTAKPEQPVPAWQAAFLPFVYQGEPQQARIYVKRDAPNKKQQAASGIGGGARFVVEVDLSEMGGIQLDGLIRKKQANTIFDLMIRSNTEISPEERNDITDIFNSAAEQTGFSGNIAFQTTSDFPVKPLDEILANQSNVVVA